MRELRDGTVDDPEVKIKSELLMIPKSLELLDYVPTPSAFVKYVSNCQYPILREFLGKFLPK